MREINNASTLIATDPGYLAVVQDGEVLFELPVPVGIHSGRDFLRYVPDGAFLEVAKSVVVLQPRSGFGRQPYGPGAIDTAANPDYTPTRPDASVLEMRGMLAQMQLLNRSMAAREASVARVAALQVIPDAPAAISEKADLIEQAE